MLLVGLTACSNRLDVVYSKHSPCDDCSYECEEIFRQIEPISVEARRCVFEMPDYRIDSEEYEFSDGTLTLVARSYAFSPERVDFVARRSEHETDVLSEQELESDLLKSAIEILRTRGKTRFEYLNPSGGSDREDFYDHVPTTRPAA